MSKDSFKFEIKVEVELKDGRLNTRIYASDEELSELAYQVQLAYMTVIYKAVAERKPFGKGDYEAANAEMLDVVAVMLRALDGEHTRTGEVRKEVNHE